MKQSLSCKDQMHKSYKFGWSLRLNLKHFGMTQYLQFVNTAVQLH